MNKSSDLTRIHDHATSLVYSLEISPTSDRVSGYIDEQQVFDTKNAFLMYETHHEPTYYIPHKDVDLSTFSRSEYRTFCPFKGNASHWSIVTEQGIIENAAWSYDTPLPEASKVKEYLAFYPETLNRFCLNGEDIKTDTHETPKEENLTLAEWLMHGVWSAENQVELTRQLVDRFLSNGIPIIRLNVAIRQLHPLLAGESYLWRAQDDQISIQSMLHENLMSDDYINSPLKLVTEGLGGIRQKLSEDQTEFEFPIMEKLRNEGATDYVALPLFFSDGHIHNLTLSTNDKNGFSTEHLGQIYEALPLISRGYELHKLKSNTATLLETYLGKSAGKQVLNGLTKRGDGEKIKAAILFCDLAGSTALSERLGQQLYLDHLNGFFDAVAQSVYSNDGDILKFIGDAVLAIFPVSDDSETAKDIACLNAAKAIRDTVQNINHSPFRDNLSCTAGLHFGEVMYGNIGSEQRLDFTVIGGAANEVARISDLCKSSQEQILLSKEFANSLPAGVKSIGEFTLKGFNSPRELYSLNPYEI